MKTKTTLNINTNTQKKKKKDLQDMLILIMLMQTTQTEPWMHSTILLYSEDHATLCDFGITAELQQSIASSYIGCSVYMAV